MEIYSRYMCTYMPVDVSVCFEIKCQGSGRRAEQDSGQPTDSLEIFQRGGREAFLLDSVVKARFEC